MNIQVGQRWLYVKKTGVNGFIVEITKTDNNSSYILGIVKKHLLQKRFKSNTKILSLRNNKRIYYNNGKYMQYLAGGGQWQYLNNQEKISNEE